VMDATLINIGVQALDARNQDAARCLRWAAQAAQALDYLEDLHTELPPTRLLPGGHDSLAVQVAHARWAAGTASTVVDLCAAALGYLYLPPRKNDRYWDYRLVRDQGLRPDVAAHPGVWRWMEEVAASADFEMVEAVRDAITHRTMPRQYEVDFTPDERVGTSIVIGSGETVPVAGIVAASRRCGTRLASSLLTRASTGRI
jgi:hypothetical protein